MLEVGLTGGIACGKSVIREHFDRQGVPTLDADHVVHDLFRTDASLREALADHFGPTIFRTDGSVDRGALGAVVFEDPAKRGELESLVHPLVFARTASFLKGAEARGALVAVVDAALMIESGSFETYDRLVVALCPRALQEERLMARSGLSREQAASRIDAQMPAKEKARYADYVIDTAGTLEETRSRSDEVLGKLQDEASRTP